MRAHTIAVFVTGGFLLVGGLFPAPAKAQNVQAQRAVQDASVKPIGKVITATGAITIEHVNAVVLQVAVGNQSGNAKVGDPIYLGDILSPPAPMVESASHLPMVPPSICRAMPEWL